MRVIGIDPSTVSTGYGVFEWEPQSRLVLLAHGEIKPNKKTMSDTEQAVFQYQALEELIDHYDVKRMGCEDQFRGPNALTYKQLCRVSGYIILLAGLKEIPLKLFTPSEWRKMVHVNGNATKKDSVTMANSRFDLRLLQKQHDIAEGICIGIATSLYFEQQTDTEAIG